MMIKVFFYLLIIAVASNAESVVLFSTNFSELPEGWTNGNPYADEWLFDSAGANACGGTCDDSWSAIMHSPAGMYFIPDGADSVVVHMEHLLQMDGEPTAEAKIFLTTTLCDIVVYWEGLPPSGGFYDDQPIHYSSEALPEGTWVGIYFWANLYTYWGMYNGLDWDIYSLTITAHGTDMAMDVVTWASIKNSFQ